MSACALWLFVAFVAGIGVAVIGGRVWHAIQARRYDREIERIGKPGDEI